MQYAASAAFLLAVYSDYLSTAKLVLTCPDATVQPQELLVFAKSQADYILGKNPKSMSYIVGYGQTYPIHVHHRGASIASKFELHSVVGCVQGFDAWYRRPQGNPNIVHGGLVGGPDKNDNFDDDRSNYEQTEPTLSGTAPLVGLLAKLHSINSKPVAGPAPTKGQIDSYSHPKVAAKPYENPVKFFHTITDSWTVGKTAYYRHKVIIKNQSEKPITDLKLEIENLSGSLWGLSPTHIKNIYELPEWIKVIKPGSESSFVYVQGGPQAKVTVQSYH